MLEAHEFTVGTFSDAAPLSLILPRIGSDVAALIGHVDKVPFAVLLSGGHTFSCFEIADDGNWSGLIIPNVRVEVDEKTIIDLGDNRAAFGSIVRLDTRLTIRATKERSSRSATFVTLHEGLLSAGNHQAAFSQWQIVVGEGQNKRLLWQTSLPRLL